MALLLILHRLESPLAQGVDKWSSGSIFFLENVKNNILKVKKIWKKYLDIDNVILYQDVKSQFKIPRQMLLFVCSVEYEVFRF
jgi:hypothetical protein